MNGKKCFICELEIKSGMKYKLEGLDKPYVNLLFHWDCYKSITNINEYLQENENRLLSYNENFQNKKKK